MIILLSVGEEIAFFFAILFLLPMAVKSGENLKQLASLGIYIRVFYEFVPRYRGEKKDFRQRQKALCHEGIEHPGISCHDTGGERGEGCRDSGNLHEQAGTGRVLTD